MPAIAFALAVGALFAQDEAPRIVDPKASGIDLLPGVLGPGDRQAVATTDNAGQPVIGRIHARVGEGAVVLLPDGQLVGRSSDGFLPTDRPFVPVEKDVLARRLAVEFAGFKTKQTNHYVYVFDTSDEFALTASRILETMLSGVKAYGESQRIEVAEPEVPLVVVMFRTEEEFQKHSRFPDGVVAYYHTLSNRVYMYEQSRLAKVRPNLAIQQAIATIAHEGAHQILHNIGVQQRLSVWPMWLSEGLAEYFAPTSTGARLRWKGAGQVNDLRMFELEQYLHSRAADEPDGRTIEETVMAERLSSTGYASAWAMTHYLAKHRRTEFNQ
ncbi:MAG: DUF1570 domain-containing protein, partial [Pirellulaceae bacterium]